MQYDNYNNRNRNGNTGWQYGSTQAEQPKEIPAKDLPADYVDAAEKVILKMSSNKKNITTNKIRNLFSMVSDIYNKEQLRTEQNLLKESKTGLAMFRIRAVYEAGRDDAVKSFIFDSDVLSYVKSIGDDRQKLIDFFHYMESLVAYHRFYISKKEG